MPDNSKIEWTDATWNPIRGCTRCSEGCRNCFAEREAARFCGPGQPFHGLVTRTPAGPRWTGRVVPAPEATLRAPLSWRKPRRIFVNSMSDLFHEDVPDVLIDRIFAVMALCPQHIFQILTKRPKRLYRYLSGEDVPARVQVHCHELGVHLTGKRQSISAAEEAEEFVALSTAMWPLANVHLGVSAEDQPTADDRIPWLLHTPAAVRFASCEPLLASMDLTALKVGNSGVLNGLTGSWASWPIIERDGQAILVCKPDVAGLDWVIAGGESGPGARAMRPDWPRALREQCAVAGVPFFFKQWGKHHPTLGPVGKKLAGRSLDGVEHNAMPLHSEARP